MLSIWTSLKFVIWLRVKFDEYRILSLDKEWRTDFKKEQTDLRSNLSALF